MGDEVVFLPADKHKSFLQGDSMTSELPGVNRVHKIKSLQYLQKNGKNEVDCLLAHKHQKYLQLDTVILGVCGQECPN